MNKHTEETALSAEATPEFPDVTIGELTERMQQAVTDAGWDTLMPVQAKSILHIMSGRDIMAQARTGSGKTGAFLLPT